jgi:hypothetical protein
MASATNRAAWLVALLLSAGPARARAETTNGPGPAYRPGQESLLTFAAKVEQYCQVPAGTLHVPTSNRAVFIGFSDPKLVTLTNIQCLVHALPERQLRRRGVIVGLISEEVMEPGDPRNAPTLTPTPP